jgi:hypothetical protein
LFGRAWHKEEKHTKAPTITQLSSRFSALAHWVGAAVLLQVTPKDRARVIVKLLELAEVCVCPND